MKQTISLQLLTCALLLTVSSMHAANKTRINGKSQVTSSSSAYNVDEQTNLNNNKVAFEAAQKFAIDNFAQEVATIYAQNAIKVVNLTTNNGDINTNAFDSNNNVKIDNSEETILKAAISKNAQFATGKNLGDLYNSLRKWSPADSYKIAAANQWIDSLELVTDGNILITQEQQDNIKNTLKAQAIAIYDAQVKYFAPKQTAQAKSAFQSRFNLSSRKMQAVFGLGVAALTSIALLLNYKFGTKSYPFQTRISTINFKIPFYSRS